MEIGAPRYHQSQALSIREMSLCRFQLVPVSSTSTSHRHWQRQLRKYFERSHFLRRLPSRRAWWPSPAPAERELLLGCDLQNMPINRLDLYCLQLIEIHAPMCANWLQPHQYYHPLLLQTLQILPPPPSSPHRTFRLLPSGQK